MQNDSTILPRSLLACFPILWRQTLFPGQAMPDTKIRWSALLWLLLVPAALLYPCLDFHLFEPDEGRYAEIPREMLARGEWVVPYLQGEPYLDKPPLCYWLVMASYQVFGVHDWSARVVPALAVHLTIFLVYLLGRRLVGERPAFWGGLLLGLAPGFLSVGRLLVLDGLLALWVTLSLLSLFEALRGARLRWGWWLVAAVACGLGILTKGPVTLVLCVMPVLVHRWLTRRSEPEARSEGETDSRGDSRSPSLRASGSWPFLAFAAVVLLVAVPWYVAVCVRLPEFAGYFFWEHNVVRFLQPFDHLEPVWFYVPILLGGLLPGTLLLLGFLRFLLSGDEEKARQRTPELGFVLLAGGWCVLFFSLSGCKLPTYILPAFPMLSLGLGWYLVRSGWLATRWPAAVGTAMFALVAFAHHLALPWYAEFKSPYSRPESVNQYCGDPEVPVVCYPRNCDSIGFYLAREDLLNYRSKDTPELVQFLLKKPRTVILFTHRHSLNSLREVLPPQLRIKDETPLFDSARAGVDGFRYLVNRAVRPHLDRDRKDMMCFMAVIERQ